MTLSLLAIKFDFGNVKLRSLVVVGRWALFAGTEYSEIVPGEINVVVIDNWSLFTGGRSGRLDCTLVYINMHFEMADQIIQIGHSWSD